MLRSRYLGISFPRGDDLGPLSWDFQRIVTCISGYVYDHSTIHMLTITPGWASEIHF
jgi:hypothetical protein